MPHAEILRPRGFPVPMSSFNMRSRQVQQNSKKILQRQGVGASTCYIWGACSTSRVVQISLKEPLLIKQGIDKVLGKVCLKKQVTHQTQHVPLFFVLKKWMFSTLFLFKLSLCARHKLHGHGLGPQFSRGGLFCFLVEEVPFGSQRHVSGHQNG